MEKYWKPKNPTTSASISTGNAQPSRRTHQTNFDDHQQTLATGKVDDGWCAELRCYLKTVFNVAKDTDVIKWWQVHRLIS